MLVDLGCFMVALPSIIAFYEGLCMFSIKDMSEIVDRSCLIGFEVGVLLPVLLMLRVPFFFFFFAGV